MDFQERVLKLTKKIPRGKITTYGIIAKKLKTSPRAVGQALKRNEHPIVIPCHRVVKSDGSLGGYTSEKYSKKELLQKEGIEIRGRKIKKFEKVLFKF
ncbi:TPA: MGMT family protein [archaeon]|uniref:MGMT family protein n=1 Tax=Candidatus Naiadarchaeum limnaeum TaxID=2756139 RepID=A0A832X6G2_9ARCH|nr:MGMT family protein [Candidatus Naiadarchaeales archaeon SRR2090153.bin1042]HIK00830.1 MGMT family protein [Candidatus Naiadarchaeum limnaeum]